MRGPLGRAAAGRRPSRAAAGRVVDVFGRGDGRDRLVVRLGGTGAAAARRPQAGLAPLAPHVSKYLCCQQTHTYSGRRGAARQRPAPRRRAPPLGHRGRPARRLAAARDGRVLHDKLLAAPEHAPLVLVQRRHDAVEERLPPGKLRREGVAIEHVDEQRPRAVVQKLGVVLDLPRVEVGEGDGVGIP